MSAFNISRFKIAGYLLIFSGIVPLSVGVYWYLQLWVFFPLFKVNEWGGCARPNCVEQLNNVSVSYIAMVNLIMTGVAIIAVSTYWIPKRDKAAWFLLLFCNIWVGTNDSVISFLNHYSGGSFSLIPILPTVLGWLGLYLSYQEIFSQKG